MDSRHQFELEEEVMRESSRTHRYQARMLRAEKERDSLRARVEALEAENERLRRAVEIVEAAWLEVEDPVWVHDEIARALRVADGEGQHG